jgi:hypothetical protein
MWPRNATKDIPPKHLFILNEGEHYQEVSKTSPKKCTLASEFRESHRFLYLSICIEEKAEINTSDSKISTS